MTALVGPGGGLVGPGGGLVGSSSALSATIRDGGFSVAAVIKKTITVSASSASSTQTNLVNLGLGGTEQPLPGCDLTIPFVSTVLVTWDVWFSHNQPGTFKHETVRLRRDSTSGALLATGDPQGAGGDGGDSSGGHQFHSTGSFLDSAPTSGHYVLGIGSVAGNATLYSDFRVLTVVAASPFSLNAFVSHSFTVNARILKPASFTVAAVIKATRNFGGSYTATARPTRDLINTGASFSAGTTGWNLVDEVTLDTSDWWAVGNSVSFFNGFGLLILAGSTITSLTVFAYPSNAAPANPAHILIRNPDPPFTTYSVIDVAQNPPNALHSSAALTARPWGGAWTGDDIGRLQIGAIGAGSFSNLRVYQLYFTIGWSYAGGITLDAWKVVNRTGTFTIRAAITGFTINAVIVPRRFTIDAEIGDTGVRYGSFTAAAVQKRVGTPFTGSLTFPGVPVTLGGLTANAHSPLIPVAAGGYIDVVLTSPPSDGGAIGVFDPVSGEVQYVTSPTAGSYRFTVLGGSYVVFSSQGAAYRPSVSGAGLYIDYARSTHTLTLAAYISRYFSLNAEIRNIKSGSFTVAAHRLGHASGTFTVRAVRQRIQARTFTLNAQIKPKTFTVSAYIQPYFTLDARIVHRIFGSFTVNAVKAGRIRLSAVIRKTQPRAFTLDAQVVRRLTGSFTVRAFVQPSFSVDATVHIHHIFQAPNRGIRVNASFAVRRTASFTLHAWIRPTFSLRAVVRGSSGTRSFSLDAEHRRIVSGSFSLRSWIQTSFSLRAVVRKNSGTLGFTIGYTTAFKRLGSFGLRAFVQPYFRVNAVIRGPAPVRAFRIFSAIGPRHVTRSFRVGAQVFSPGAYWDPIDETWRWLGFTVSAVFGRHVSRSFTLAARIFAPGVFQATFDAVVRATAYGAFRLNAEKGMHFSTGSGSISLEAWVVGTRASFTINAELVGQTKRASFTVGATTVAVGGRLGLATLDAYVRGVSSAIFRINAYIDIARFRLDAVVAGRRFRLDAFIDRYFRLDAVTRVVKARSFTLDYRWAPNHRAGTFTLDGFKGVVGQKYGLISLRAVVKGTRSTATPPFLPYLYLSAYVRGPSHAFTVSAFISRQFTVSAYVQPYFHLDAYVQGINIIYWPPDGSPPTYGEDGPPVTGGGKVSRKFRIKIELGIPDPDSVDPEVASYWEARCAVMATYINTYEAIPESKRTPEQQAALETDRETYAKDVARYQAALTPKLDWVDYTGDVVWRTATFTQAARTGIGNFSFALDGPFPELMGGEEVHLLIDDRRVFGGFVTNVDHQYNFSGYASPRTVLTGVDYNVLFDRLFVYNVLWEFDNFVYTGDHSGGYKNWNPFPVGTPDAAIIEKVMRDYVGFNAPPDLDYTTGVVPISTPATEVPWAMPEAGSPLRTVFQSISMITSAVWYIDAYKVLRYHDRSTVTAPYPITDGYGGISSRDLAISRDMSAMFNEDIVWGLLAQGDDGARMTYSHQLGDGHMMERYYQAAVEEISGYISTYEAIPPSERTAAQKQALAIDKQTLAYDKRQLALARANPGEDSIAKYGRTQWGEPRQDIFHQKWLDKRAMSILSRYQYPILKAEATIFEPYYAAGQVVRLISRAYDIDNVLAISQMTITFAVPREPQGSTWFAFPQYHVTMGLDPEAPWNIYDFLPYPGQNEAGLGSDDSSSSNPGSGGVAGGGNAKGVAQRRFWNAMKPVGKGVIYIGSYGGLEQCQLLASKDGCHWEHVYSGAQLASGPLPFPDRFKLYRYWRMTYEFDFAPAGQNYGGLHINEWILKPYDDDMDLTGPSSWYRGDPTANLFWKSSPFWREDANGDYDASGPINTRIRYEAHIKFTNPITHDQQLTNWTNFGGGNGLYGYVNDQYFGYNQFGGNKPNIGIPPKYDAVGDLSKVFTGFWGAFGTMSGIPDKDVTIRAQWTFDLCREPDRLSVKGMKRDDYVQSEGWGSEWCVTNAAGVFETMVTPQRSTLTVYDRDGYMLHDGIHYEQLKGDTSGRRYKMLLVPTPPVQTTDQCPLTKVWTGTDSTGAGESPSRCDDDLASIAVSVTYLVSPPTISPVRRTVRITNSGITADRLERNDIKGL